VCGCTYVRTCKYHGEQLERNPLRRTTYDNTLMALPLTVMIRVDYDLKHGYVIVLLIGVTEQPNQFTRVLEWFRISQIRMPFTDPDPWGNSTLSSMGEWKSLQCRRKFSQILNSSMLRLFCDQITTQ
jgi:hypothetical protein